MENSESRTVKINGKSYEVKGKELSSKIEATVYEEHETTNVKSPMVEITESKRKWFGLVKSDDYDELPEVMKRALTQAVESVEEERMQSEKIDTYIENIKDTYDNE